MDRPPKKSTAKELAEQAVIASAGMVPIAGSPLAVAFALAMGWSYNKRMRDWLEDLAEAVDDLQRRDERYLTIEDLADNPVFTDAVVNATRAAQATHQADKLEALRNAVINSVSPGAPSPDEQARFFRLVEEFTPAHLVLLRFLDNPERWFLDHKIRIPNYMSGSITQLIEDGIAEFRGQREWYLLIADDLQSARLLSRAITGMMTGAGLWQRSTSDLGHRFLAFIDAG